MLDTSTRTANRRQFLRASTLMAVAFAASGVTSQNALFAETKIAARIAEANQSHALMPAIKLAAKSLEAMENVKDYEAVIVKRELIGDELETTQMQIKFRESPMSVYLKFIEPHAGREILFQPGKHNDNMLVHETGIASLVGSLEIEPDSSLAMEHNRYPINRIGLKNLLTLNIDRWIRETRMDGVDVKYYPSAKIGKLSCKVLQITYAKKTDKTRYQSSRLFIDNETNLPIRMQNYDFPTRAGGKPVLVEDYYYSNLKTNVGLKDIDFDPENPNYDF